MRNKKRYITGGLTIAAVATSAYLMQTRGGVPDDPSQASVGPVAAAAAATVDPATGTATPGADTEISASGEFALSDGADPVVANKLPVPPVEALMPAPLPQNGTALRDRMADTAADPVATDVIRNEPPLNQFGLSCGAILSASVTDAAMVTLTLTAPCKGEEVITVRHGALVFSDRLNQLGTYIVDVPAMTAAADFTIEFADGSQVQTDIAVPLSNDLERVALLYQGDAGLQIHALEFGAGYDDEGHIWSGATRNPTDALKSGGGYMTLLGSRDMPDALRAEIYTFPGEAGPTEGLVQLSIEAEVTALNCDTEVGGQTIERIAANTTNTVTVTVSMPDCTAVGEYLVLNNLLRDLKIASN